MLTLPQLDDLECLVSVATASDAERVWNAHIAAIRWTTRLANSANSANSAIANCFNTHCY
ncbi:hypothetical protein Scep_026929 [Stephania cephalantha]|uniref:Uncharacterized protein n=1 Tax=Stephania cephalantha TaxID=152367 RepID=A0AAP0HTQ8_9MAGN